MATERISSLDSGYTVGDLSVFPLAYDEDKDLYVATNNAETTLKQALSYNGAKIIVEDASHFPDSGILRIGTAAGKPGTHEFVYYDSRTASVFTDLIRGYSNSRQNRWIAGTPVTSGVMADHMNAIRDTIINIETDLGVRVNPATDSLNDLLIKLESKWLAPRPLFRAVPDVIGPAPLTVRFQNFTLAHAVRFLWDFGDGSTSTERSPTHVYRNEGNYTVRLDIITNLGGTGMVNKYSYITVDNDQITPFFYTLADDSTPGNYSVETAAELTERTGIYVPPTKFHFVDQTDGSIRERFWVWDDGTTSTETDPNIHATTHYYQKRGTYNPSLLIVLSSTLLKRAYLQSELIVN